MTALALLAPGRALAQFCFRGRPLPACRTFITTEFGFGARAAEAHPVAENLVVANWELGMLVNTGPRTAWGATVMAGFNGGGTRAAVKARYRRWLSATTALDVAPGLVLAGGTASSLGALRTPGMTAHVGVTWRDLVGAGLDLESVRFVDDAEASGPVRSTTSVGASARLGSFGGVAGGVVAAGLVVAYFVALASVLD